MIRHILACLSSVMLISSCTGGKDHVMAELVAADSLLNVNPQLSLDIIVGLDSSGRLSRREIAYRDYLLVSSRYKCYLSVADDTSVFHSAEYFRRRGPEEYYGKSLMMQGAVLFEQDRLEEALDSYKSAETVFEEHGSYLDLGLVNARMGEIYRVSYVNDSASVARFGKALRYFELSGDKKRIAASSLDYARSVMADSLDVADELIMRSLKISEEIKDSSLMMYAHELSAYAEVQKGNHLKFIELADSLLSELKRADMIDELTWNNLNFKKADSYAELGMPDKAMDILSDVVICSDTDSLLYYYAWERIAGLKKDWQEAYHALERSAELYNDIVAANYGKRLVEAELQYDLSVARQDFYKRRNENLVIIIFLLLGLSMSALFILIVGNRLKTKKREVLEYADKLMLAEEELNEAVRQRDAIDNQIEKQRKGNQELQKLSGELMNIINEIGYAYEIHKDNSNPARMVESIKHQIETSLSYKGFKDKAGKIVEILYPGMLDEIFAEAEPALTEEERWIIILMCCNFETNTICVFSENSVTQLNNKKSRIARKLHSQERLSKYLMRKTEEYVHGKNDC